MRAMARRAHHFRLCLLALLSAAVCRAALATEAAAGTAYFGVATAAPRAWAVAFPSAADWSAPRPAGALPRCAFPGAAADAAPTQLRTLCVIGERHSGTNFVSALLDLNFAFDDDADADRANATDALRSALRAHPRLKDGLGRVPPRPGRVGHGCAHRAAQHVSRFC